MTSEIKNKKSRSYPGGFNRPGNARPQGVKFGPQRPPPSNKKKRSRRGRREKEGSRLYDMKTTAPASFGRVTCYGEPTKTAVMHKDHGKGTRMTGTQILCFIGTNGSGTSSSNLPFYTGGAGIAAGSFNGASDSTGAYWTGLYINPAAMVGRLNYESLCYTQYAFRKFVLKYRTASGSNATGLLGLTLTQDPITTPELTTSGTSPSFLNLTQSEPNISISLWKDGNLGYSYNGSKLWFITNTALSLNTSIPNDYPGASSLSKKEYSSLLRDTVQMRVGGVFPLANASFGTYGVLECDYVVDMHYPQSPNSGQVVGSAGTETLMSSTSIPSVVSSAHLESKLGDRQSYVDVVKSQPGPTVITEEPRLGWLGLGRKAPSVDLNRG